MIERVAAGAKEAFTDMEAIGRVIAGMLQGERPLPRAAQHTFTNYPEERWRYFATSP